MKKLVFFIIALSLLLSIHIPVLATSNVADPAKLPESVKITPYADSQFTSVYSPWLKLFHMTTTKQKELGLVGGEACQQIRCMAISPHDPNVMLMGTDTNGIWKSTDGGNYWYQVGYANIVDYPIQYIFYDRIDPNSVYMVSVSNSGSDICDGVYKSTDLGETWVHVLDAWYAADGINAAWVDKLVAQDLNGVLWAISIDGVSKSTDGGKSWVRSYTIRQDFVKGGANSIDVSDDGKTIIAGYSYAGWEFNGLIYSLDGGKTWDYTNPEGREGATTVDIDPDDKNHWIVSFVNPETKKGDTFYETYDSGKTWSLLSYVGKEIVKTKFGPKRDDGTRYYYMHLGKSIWPMRVSNDGGKTWTESKFDMDICFQNDYTGWFPQGFDVSPHDPNLVINAHGGVYKSFDGGYNFTQWSNSGNSGLNISNIYFDKDKNMLLGCVDVGLVVSESPFVEENYPAMHLNSKNYLIMNAAFDPNDSNHIIGYNTSSGLIDSTAAGYIMQSWDQGKTWHSIGGEKITGQIVFGYDNEDLNTIYASDFTSYDNGETWVKNEHKLSGVSPVDSNVFIKTEGEKAERKLFMSIDKGKNWEEVGLIGTNQRKIVPSPIDKDTVFVICDHKILEMTRGKGIVKEFTVAGGAGAETGNFYWSFAQNPKNPEHLLIGLAVLSGSNKKSPGLMESLDGGDTWHVVPGIPGHRTIYTIKFAEHLDKALVCSMTGMMIYDYNVYHKFLKEKVYVAYNGQEVSFEVMPQFKDDSVMVPIRSVSEMLGATVSWDEKNSIIIISKGRKQTVINLNEKTAVVNDEKKDLSSVYLYENRTMVPIRFVCEALGCSVGWREEARKVVIED